jgi:hypothetical protein
MHKPVHEASLNHVLRSVGRAESRAPQRPRIQSGQLPLGVNPADGLAKKAAAGEKTTKFDRSCQFLPPPPPPDG